MKWMEIITLRSLVNTNRHLVDELLRQLSQQEESWLGASISVYRHPVIDTDLSIHINWENGAQPPGKSALGQQLSYALKGLGLLSYSIWVEIPAME